MKRVILLLAVSLSLIISAYSQISNNDLQLFYDEFNELKKLNNKPYSSYDGTPYLNNEFITGSITLRTGVRYTGIPLRYNIYNDNFEFTKNNEALALDKSDRFHIFSIGERKFIFSSYEFLGESRTGYLEEIIDGRYSLYLKHSVLLKEAETPEPYKEARKATFYLQKPDMLIGDETGRIVGVRNSKEFPELFPHLEESVKKYTGNKKLRLKIREDYIDLINWLNTN